MNKDKTSQKVLEICKELSKKYNITIMLVNPEEFEDIWIKAFIHNLEIIPKSSMLKFKEHLNKIAGQMKNKNATFCFPFGAPMIVLHPFRFNCWLDLDCRGYSEKKFLDCVETILMHEIGHFLHWKSNPKEFNSMLNSLNIETLENLELVELTDETLKRYFERTIEQKANQYAEVNVKKLIHYSKMLSYYGNKYFKNQALGKDALHYIG